MNNELSIAKKSIFEGVEIECYENENGDFLITRKQIGEALEYKTASGYNNILLRNAEEIGEPVIHKLCSTDGKYYDTELYTFEQLFQILRFSKQPRANAFMNWSALTMKQLIMNKAALKFKTEEDANKYKKETIKIMEEMNSKIKLLEDKVENKFEETNNIIYLLDKKIDDISFKQPITPVEIFEDKLYQIARDLKFNLSFIYPNFYREFENWLGYKLPDKSYIKITTKDYIIKNLLDEMIYFVDSVHIGRIAKSKQGNWVDLAGVFKNNIEWEKILGAFDHRCAYCGCDDKPLIAEHLYSKTRMARFNVKKVNLIENIVPSCEECNDDKFDKNIEDWYNSQSDIYSKDNWDKIREHKNKYLMSKAILDKVGQEIISDKIL